jgi:hypothetical protein
MTLKKTKFFFVALLLVCYLFIGSVSAETTFSETYNELGYSFFVGNCSSAGDLSAYSDGHTYIYTADQPGNYSGLYYLSYEGSHMRFKYNSGYINSMYHLPIIIDDLVYGNLTGEFNYLEKYNALGNYASSNIWITIEDSQDVKSVSQGVHKIIFPTSYEISCENVFRAQNYNIISQSDPQTRIGFTHTFLSSLTSEANPGISQCVCQPTWENSISGEYGLTTSSISLNRNGYYSNFSILDSAGEDLIYNNYDDESINYVFPYSSFRYLIESPSGREYTKTLRTESTGDGRVSVVTYVKSNADSSLIGGASVNYTATSENDTVNQTLSSGVGTFRLLKNVEYSIYANAEGYTTQTSLPETITATGDTSNDVWLVPVGETTGNETGLVNFYVYQYADDGSSVSRLSGAIITVNSEKTLITNSAGYASFEINKTSELSYTVSKSGYESYSRSYTPSWGIKVAIEEYVYLVKKGQTIGDVTPTPTEDTRTNEDKAESALDFVLDNIEGISELATLILIVSMISWLGGKK